MADFQVEYVVTGIEELLQRYEQGDEVADALLTTAMQGAVDYLATDATIYAAESEANQPPPPYYIRGVGTQYASGANRGESKQLGQHWEREVVKEDKGIVGTVEIKEEIVPYAKYVLGFTMQTPSLREKGWRTTYEIMDENSEHIQEFFDVATDEFVQFLNGG